MMSRAAMCRALTALIDEMGYTFGMMCGLPVVPPRHHVTYEPPPWHPERYAGPYLSEQERSLWADLVNAQDYGSLGHGCDAEDR